MSHAVYVVTIEVAPEAEQRWNEWHGAHHVPAVLREPGFLGARKFRAADLAPDGWIRYVMHFELESLEALQRFLETGSQRLRQEHVELFGTVTRVSRQSLVEVPLPPAR
jgi:antibiotic biosynthesis monooxygenase (ABM) superfamily enzyme